MYCSHGVTADCGSAYVQVLLDNGEMMPTIGLPRRLATSMYKTASAAGVPVPLSSTLLSCASLHGAANTSVHQNSDHCSIDSTTLHQPLQT